MSKARDPYPARLECCFITNDGPWVAKPPAWCRRPVWAESGIYCEAHHRACYIRVPKKPYADRKPIIFQRIAPR